MASTAGPAVSVLRILDPSDTGTIPAALAMSALLKTIDKDYKNNPEIKWNFTKFVINREGEVVARFEPTADMKKVEECVASLI